MSKADTIFSRMRDNPEWRNNFYELKNQIREMSADQTNLKKQSKGKSAALRHKLSFAFALVEYVTTGKNVAHKGRSDAYNFYSNCVSGNATPFLLLEEIGSKRLRAYCRSRMSELLTLEDTKSFCFSDYRRFYSAHTKIEYA